MSLRDPDNFLSQHLSEPYALKWLAQDASTRRYARIHLSNHEKKLPASYILMQAPAQSEAPPCPAGADKKIRQELGENALRRLAASRCEAFAAIGQYLAQTGLKTPNILAADYENGYLLLEDLGGQLAALNLQDLANETEIYQFATELLIHLHHLEPVKNLPVPLHNPTSNSTLSIWPILQYDEIAFLSDVEIFLDWASSNKVTDTSALNEWVSLWQGYFKELSSSPQHLLLRDFHVENMIWRPNETGLHKIALLDFQDAVIGPRLLDLVMLCDDARRNVSLETRNLVKQHYLSAFPDAKAGFDQEYAILSAHFNIRLLGLFERLHKRDGKLRYTGFIPQVTQNLARSLTHSVLRDLSRWLQKNAPTLFQSLIDRGSSE